MYQMNICFFSKEYPPETHVGGIGTYTYNMASALVTLGHTVHVISSTMKNDRSEWDRGVRVHRIQKQAFRLKELSLLSYSYAVAKKVSRINCEFDIIQSSEYGGEAFFFALRKKYPLITRLATPYFLIERMNGKVFVGPRPLFNWMEKKQTLLSDGVFTSTRAIAEAVTDEWEIDVSAVEIIPNSVDVSRIVELGKGEPGPDISAGDDYLLYFGRLEERKGIHILARALPEVFRAFPHIKMVFVGSDDGYRGSSMKEHIESTLRKFSKQIVFIDNLAQKDLFPIVRGARMVVLPSLWEAFGFVCVEAMALGRPVIASSGSGFQEIIEDNASGYLVEPGNSRLLAEKIISCLQDSEALLQVSEAARQRAQDFEVSKIALRLLTFFEETKEKWLRKRGN
jgi:glycogen(starch) synthase